MLPLDWLRGPPPTRHWLVAEKAKPLAGSVLLAGGDAEARAHTTRLLRAFLPPSWEIVHADAVRECAQWNRAIAAARGDVVWFLRGGAEPTAGLFAILAARAGVGPVAAAIDGQRLQPGDLAGLMLPRLDLLAVGPLPEAIANSRIALEDYAMQLEAKLMPVQLVPGQLVCPPAAVEAACVGKARREDVDVESALPANVRQQLSRLAPASLKLPSGREAKLEYRDAGIVAASIKLQHVFGLADSPKLGPRHVPVTFELLAPSGRPVQVTSDLRSFWSRTYGELRNQLRIRYPKHQWPENPV